MFTGDTLRILLIGMLAISMVLVIFFPLSKKIFFIAVITICFVIFKEQTTAIVHKAKNVIEKVTRKIKERP